MPDPAQAPKLFFAFATGNNHANLPILINLAKPGDTVCWVVTKTAKELKWAEGSIKLLKGRGIASEPLEVPNDIIYRPKDFENRFQSYIDERFPVDAWPDIYFLLVGGQKLNIQAISQFRETQIAARKSVSFLYQDLKPCCYYVLGPHDEAYQQWDFTEPFLFSYLVESHKWGARQRKLGDADRNATEPLRPAYGVGAEDCYEPDARFEYLFGRPAVQQCLYDLQERKFKDPDENADVPNAARHIASSRPLVERWENHLISGGLRPETMREGHKRSLLYGLGKFFRDATIEALRSGSNPLAELSDEERFSLECAGVLDKRRGEGEKELATGDLFEDATWVRVKRFLDAHAELMEVVSQVYRNVKLYSSPDAPKGEEFIELDILFVLNNASLVAVECKSRPLNRNESGSERKDSLARQMNLNRTAGLGAHFLYCIPFFPPPSDDARTPTSFLDYHNSFVNLKEWGIGRIYYDDPQRGSTGYRITTVSASADHSYKPFEETLEQVLSSFLPKPAGLGATE